MTSQLNEKEKNRRYMQEWREQNREKLRRYQKAWRKKNPEKCKEYSKRYIEKNREKINRRHRDWVRRNRKKNREWQRKWRAANPEKYKEYEENKKRKMGEKNYREWKKSIYERARKKVEKILGTECSICNRGRSEKRRIHYHEIHGKKHPAGPFYVLNHVDDFIPLCSWCHIAVHQHALYGKEIQQLAELLRRNRK